MRTASIPGLLYEDWRDQSRADEEPIDPTMLISAPVVASSAGVATIATIDLSPGLTTCEIALETKITKRRSPRLVPSRNGVRIAIAPSARFYQ